MKPHEYAESLAAIRDAARSSGRDPGSIVPGHQLVAVIGRTEAEARSLLGAPVMRFLTLLAPAQLWAVNNLDHPLGSGFRGIVDFVPAEHTAEEIRSAMAKVPIDVVAENVLWGTPDQIRHSLEDQVDAGLRHIVVSPASAAVSRRNAVYSVRATISILRRVRRSANARLGAG